MAEEIEVEPCPYCGIDAVIIYQRVRTGFGEIDAEAREAVHCPNPDCVGRDAIVVRVPVRPSRRA